MRKVLYTMLVLILIAAIPIQAMAETGYGSVLDSNFNNQQIGILFVYTEQIYAALSISGGMADCSGFVQPASEYSASIRVVLYRSVDGSSWTSIASWSGSAGVGEIASAEGSKTLTSGYQYKVTAFGTVRNASGTVVESPTKTSAIKTY